MSAPTVSSAHTLSLAPTMTSTMRSTASPPRPASMKPPSPPSLAREKGSPTSVAGAESKSNGENHTMASPPPLPKLPEVAPHSSTSPKNATASSQAPAQLALLLSNALADADALRRALAEEKKRAARAERLLSSFHPNAGAENGISEEQKNEQMSEGALKAVLDAEARAERAERARDDAVHALHSLTAQFTDLERYEASLSLRAADARSAFARLLANITASHPPPAASPTLSGGGSGSPSTLILPGLPPPLPAPSAGIIQTQYLTGPGAPPPPPPPSSTRYTRALPSHAPPSFGYASSSYSHGAGHARQNSHTHSATFSSLPLPPPPSASGLGAGLIGGSSAPPPSSSSSFSVPAKRVHRSRSARGLDDGAGGESAMWEESKRRRVGAWDMDIDEPGMAHVSQVEQPLPYPQHQPPLSAHPTQRVYDRDSVQQQQSFARNGAYPARYEEREMNGTAGVNGNGHGLGRVDARELVRDAKERERRGRSSHYRAREGERRRRRSASRSSAGSSWSIDEMLLETATDRERERREDGRPSPVGSRHEQPVLGQYHSHVFAPAVSGPPPPSSSNAPPLQDEPSYVDHSTKKAGSHSSQASNGSVGGVNGVGERERIAKVPATQLVTLGPGGVVVSGGGPTTSMPGGSFPAQNTSGQRICRQCGVPGRYKDGKCVEKWGPGPEGPGTVCDRCRKKMKRVERRGTLDSSAASAHQQAFLAHRQSQSQGQNQLQAHPTLPVAPSHSPAHPRARTAVRTDTLIVDQNGHPHSQTQSTMLSPSPRPSQQHVYSRERERSRDGRSHEGSSRSHSPIPSYNPTPTAGSVRHGQASPHYSQSQSQSQSQGHRRAPTPPYITSISTRDQYEDDDGDGEEDVDNHERDGKAELDVDAEIVRAASVGKGTKSASRNAMAYPPSNVPRVAPNGTVYPPVSAPAPSSSRASSTSTTAFEKRGGSKKVKTRAMSSTSKRIPLPSVATLSRPARRRDLQDELDEDDAEGDADGDADGSGDADADAEIMDAVDAAMKVED